MITTCRPVRVRAGPGRSWIWVRPWSLLLTVGLLSGVPFALAVAESRGVLRGRLAFSDIFLVAGLFAILGVAGVVAILQRSEAACRTLSALVSPFRVSAALVLVALQVLSFGAALRSNPAIPGRELLFAPSAVIAVLLVYPAIRGAVRRQHRQRSATKGKPLSVIARAASSAVILVFAATTSWLAISTAVNGDEASTAILYATDYWLPLTRYDSPNNHPLHSLLVWLSLTILGPSPAALRLPAALGGLAMLIGAGALARRIGGTPGLAVAIPLLASQLVALRYSSEARGYSLAAAFALAAVWECLGPCHRRVNRLGVWLALGLLTVPTNLYISLGLLAAALPLLRATRFTARVRGRAISGAVLWSTVAVVLPWSGMFVLRKWHGLPLDIGHGHLDPKSAAADAAALFVADPVALLLVLCGLAGVMRCGGRWGQGARLAALVLLGATFSALSIAVLQGRIPYARNLIPVFVLLLTAGAGAFGVLLQAWGSRHRELGAILLGLIAMTSTWQVNIVRVLEPRTENARTCPASRAAEWLLGRHPRAGDRTLALEYMFTTQVAWELTRRGHASTLTAVDKESFERDPQPGERLWVLVGDPYPPTLELFGRASRGCCGTESTKALLGHHLVCEQVVAPTCAFGRHPASWVVGRN